MRVIYVDVLLLINLYVTYFLIRSTNIFTHSTLTSKRCFVCAAVGSISSLLIFIPELNFFVLLIVKLIFGAGITALAFGVKDKRQYLISLITFLIMNFVFAGLIMAAESIFTPINMTYKNGAAYADISLLAIIISTMAAYAIIRLVRYYLDSKTTFDEKFTVCITSKGETVVLKAFADTGNSLIDVFSGLPIIICDCNAVEKLIPNEIAEYLKCKAGFTDTYEATHAIRLVPCSTVAHTGIIPVFKPEKTAVYSDSKRKEVNALIGVSTEGFSNRDYLCIFNPKIL